MSSKTDTEVIIGGKNFTLSGYESEEYLQKVASYINNKINEYRKVDSFRRQPKDTQNVLLQLNIADDYFKAKKQIAVLEEDIQTREKELYDLKHELITSQIKLENAQKQVRELQREINENTKKLIRLETKLGDTTDERTQDINKTEDKKGYNAKNFNKKTSTTT
jgi:cell division protein ZapA